MTGREMLYGVCNATSIDVEDLIGTVKELSSKVTDDCTWAGVELLACELLGCSEETLNTVLDEE